jgi:hypothetical protein
MYIHTYMTMYLGVPLPDLPHQTAISPFPIHFALTTVDHYEKQGWFIRTSETFNTVKYALIPYGVL